MRGLQMNKTVSVAQSYACLLRGKPLNSGEIQNTVQSNLLKADLIPIVWSCPLSLNIWNGMKLEWNGINELNEVMGSIQNINGFLKDFFKM